MAYKGKYKPINKKKYLGDSSNIVYRSLWERRFMVFCDTNKHIVQWSSEEVIIPYRSPKDKKIHRYFPDFLIYYKDAKTNEIKIYLIEVKPEYQTKPPVSKKNKKRYLRESMTYAINEAKWNAAIAFCQHKGWEFKILTEKTLGIG